MTKINKKSIIALIVALAAVVAILGSILFAANSTSSDTFGTGMGGAYPNVNVVNAGYGSGDVPSGHTQSGLEITDKDTLISFLKGEKGTEGYLNVDSITIGADTGIDMIPAGITLDGNGKTIKFEGISDFTLGEIDYAGNAATEKWKFLDSSISGTQPLRAAGGLAQALCGTIKNTKFEWNSTITQSQTASDRSITIGLIAGICNGTIENCSVTINNNVSIRYQLKDLTRDPRFHTVALGGFVGVLAGKGKVSNSTINMNATLTGKITGYKDGRTAFANCTGMNRLFIGGVAGVMNSNSFVTNITTLGTGNFDAYADPYPSYGSKDKKPNVVAASGIIAGCNATAIVDTVTGQDANMSMGAYGGNGTIDGVFNMWTGTARANHGRGEYKTFGDTGLTADFKKATSENIGTGGAGEYYNAVLPGVIAGLAGTWNGSDASKDGTGNDNIYNVYYIGMSAPAALAARNWTPEANRSKGYSISVNDNNAGGSCAFSFKNADGGTPDATAIPTLTYTTPTADNQIVWSVNLKKNDALSAVDNVYERVGSVNNVSKFTTWNSGAQITRGQTVGGDKYLFEIDNGLVLAAGNVNDLQLDGTNNVYQAAEREFDGTAIPTPKLNLYKDWDFTNKVGVYENKAIWNAYKGGQVKVDSLDDTKDAADWVLKIPTTADNAVVLSGKLAGENFVVFQEPKIKYGINFKQTITPKTLTASWKTTPHNSVYDGNPVNFDVQLDGIVNGFPAQAEVKYYLSNNDPVAQAIKAQSYIAKTTGLNSTNYKLQANLSETFDITKRPITIEQGNIDLTYTGLDQKPSVAIVKSDNTTYFSGDENSPIKVKNLVDDGVISVNYVSTAANHSFKDAGNYTVEIGFASGDITSNYEFAQDAQQTIGYEIKKHVLSLEIASDESTTIIEVNGVPQTAVVRQYVGNNIANIKFSYNKPENGTNPNVEVMYALVNGEGNPSPWIRNVGEYRFTATLPGQSVNNANYQLADGEFNGYLVIQPRALSITWDATFPTSIPFDGNEHPCELATVSGLVGKDTVTLSYTYTKNGEVFNGVPRDAGTYEVKAILADSNISNNYTVDSSQNTKAFDITPMDISIKAKAVSRQYGYANPTFEWEYVEGSNQILADDLGGVTINLQSEANEASIPGKYAVTYVDATGDKAANYNITFVDSPEALEIIPREIHATIDTLEITYGENPFDKEVVYTLAEGSSFIEADQMRIVANFDYVQFGKAGTYNMTATLDSNAGYEKTAYYNLIVDGENNLIVNKKTINVASINWAVADNTYDGTNKQAKVVVNDGEIVNNDQVEFTLEYTFNGAVTTNTAAAGQYDVVATLTDGRYELAETAFANLTIAKRNVTLTLADIKVVYGTEKPTDFGVTYASGSLEFVASDNVTTTASTEYNRTSVVGSYAISVTTNADKNNYNVVVDREAFVVVSPKTITATLTMPTDFVYNAVAKQVEVQFSGIINNDLVAPVITYNDETEAIDAGKYVVKVTCDNENYVVEPLTTGNEFTITPAELKFSVENGTKGYHSAQVVFANDSIGYSYEGEIYKRDAKGVYINVAVAEIAEEKLGETYPNVLYITLSGAKAGNYTATTISKGAVTIEANKLSNIVLSSDSNVYDATNHKDTIQILNAKLDDFTITYSSDEFKNAGTYTITLVLKESAKEMYDTTEGTEKVLTYTITKRQVTLVATDKVNVTYGDNKPADADMWAYGEGSLQFVESDNVVVTVNNAYTNTTNAGADIDVTFSTTANDNYDVVLPEGVKMNISKKALTATFAQPDDLTFDNTAKVMGVTLEGMVNGEAAPAVTITYNGATEAKGAGEYEVVVSIAEGNYTVDATTTMTINARELTVAFTLPTELAYNKTAKTATATFGNLPEGVTEVAHSIVYKQGENVVENAINAGDYVVDVIFSDNNYTLAAHEPATFTITKKDVTATIEVADTTYTGSAIKASVKFEGVLEGDEITSYTLTYNGAAEAINAGEYAVALTITDPNYNLAEEVAATLNITKANQTLTNKGLSVVANYNKLTVNGGTAKMEYKLQNGNWQKSNVFGNGIKAETNYTIVVRLVGDDNHNASNEVTLTAVKTGVDPTPINAKLDTINDTFGFEDIAVMKEIEEMISKIAAQDMSYIDNAKLSNAREAYAKFVEDVNTVVNEAQIAAAKAAGRNVGAAAAAATAASVSLLGVALAIAKKKMLF